MEAIVFHDGKVELRLRDMNLDMLRRTNARDGARRDGRGDDLGQTAVEGQGGLGVPGIIAGKNVIAAGTINFETAGNLTAPFWFFGWDGLARS